MSRLPPVIPGIVIVQHMPSGFTQPFAKRLNTRCKIEVREARDGDAVIPGVALLAPGDKHMLVKGIKQQYSIELKGGPPVTRHKPSVDVLFRSVAQTTGANAIGIIMTGMGDDGALGLKEMLDAGAKTMAQDEESCAVFGMPKKAIECGATNKAISLDKLPNAILECIED